MACAGACAGQGIHDDGTSVSFGPPNRGALVNPLVLPPSGDGYWMPPTWARRGLHYGTGELVGMIAHLGRDLAQRGAGRPLAVADLSPQRGGPSRWHRSHQTGRDVDLIYFARDAEGRPVPADSMRHFRADGASVEQPVVYFDDRANWLLVRALIENPVADVQWIFVHDDLKQRMLDHAVRSGEPGGIVAAAAILMHQPTRALPHDDHMHVRIYCDSADVRLGCEEIGPIRWFKKAYKYRGLVRAARAADLVPRRGEAGRGMVMAALPTLPLRGFVPR